MPQNWNFYPDQNPAVFPSFPGPILPPDVRWMRVCIPEHFYGYFLYALDLLTEEQAYDSPAKEDADAIVSQWMSFLEPSSEPTCCPTLSPSWPSNTDYYFRAFAGGTGSWLVVRGGIIDGAGIHEEKYFFDGKWFKQINLQGLLTSGNVWTTGIFLTGEAFCSFTSEPMDILIHSVTQPPDTQPLRGTFKLWPTSELPTFQLSVQPARPTYIQDIQLVASISDPSEAIIDACSIVFSSVQVFCHGSFPAL